ncbi:SIR2 family protein [Mesorhizobium sp. B2-7-2]|uniref:SIR2 family protein n=1 Tax=Mesorhizobium sp. B2-7-2 TaxID=2589908 RepID=UPI00112E5437|nr:SIR2 family protein [Mesorhizobium sp. B2-7-2]TPJ18222.1 hypothetical protein FJ425_27810 [Mesorhizobium sp. B2-7-2]
MTISLKQLINDLIPRKTVLLFGAGSTIPSGAPAVSKIIGHFSSTFGIDSDKYTLSEISSLAENRFSRKKVIAELRKLCSNLHPQGGLKNLSLYDWKSIYTTNYDNLVEQTYEARGKSCRVFSSNFDFTISDSDYNIELFKIHGTIDKDISDGNVSRIILSEADYEQTDTYREYIYDRLKGDLAGANLIIIGQSLTDPDLKSIVNRAAALNAKVLNPAKITLLLFQKDEDRASLFEQRGITVAFGGIDDFFAELARSSTKTKTTAFSSAGSVDEIFAINPSSIDVASSANAELSDVSAMFNGWPASYADIEAGLTFGRTLADAIQNYLDTDSTLCATVLGAAGVGKSTAVRQAILRMSERGDRAWEHQPNHRLTVANWLKVAGCLRESGERGVLFIDDAHVHLSEINDLIDRLAVDNNAHLKLVFVSTRNQWSPRIKTPNIFKFGKEFSLSRLSPEEIERLLQLIDKNTTIRSLVEETFSGFSKNERRRRLAQRCEADMFVCFKNIFAVEAFDDIILREFAELGEVDQDVYRYVAAMENAGVRVHRQFVIRLLGIPAPHISQILTSLSDIIHEYDIDDRLGIYGWRCRHVVISEIITRFKFKDTEAIVDLFDRVIDSLSPTYDIEIRTIRELCNVQTGIARIPDKNVQNRLLRKIISNAPGERVPRHRLIRNLIDQGAFEKAETEIRLFGKDFGPDGPVHRYKIRLMIARAVRTPGILEEDRIAILEQANTLAVSGVERYPHNKNILSAYAELGIEYYRRTGSYQIYDEAINQLKIAEERLGDPEITAIIARYERRLAGQTVEQEDTVAEES